MASKSPIRLQAERIIDEEGGRKHQVIVRMASDDSGRDAVLRAAAFEGIRRRLSLSARDLLPKTVKKSRGQLSSIKGGAGSRSLKVRATLPVAKKAAIKKQAGRDLKSLAANASVQRAAEAKTVGGLIRQFWTSRSALLELTSDQLADLSDEPGEIREILPNRSLKVPRVIEVNRLPANIEDNKASAWGVAAIGGLAAWGAYGARGNGVTVGILDTGVDATHPDLAGKVSAWAEFDNLGQEVVGSTPHDTDEHGTHTAGTVVGGDAGGSWIGVAPDARLAAALVLDGAVGGTDAQVLAGLDWAVDEGVDVISMSLGGLVLGPEIPSTYTEAMLTALRAGIPVVTAIGNDGSQTSGSPGNDLFAYGVGATDHRDEVAGFSGGRTQVITTSAFIPPEFLPLAYSKPDVSAPGIAVRSSVPGGGYSAFNGTSMATPHVAGAMAVLLSATQIRAQKTGADRAFSLMDLITGSVEELGESGQDHRFGFGRIDLLRAIGFAREAGF